MKRAITAVLERCGLIGPMFAFRQFLWRLKPAAIRHNLQYRLHGAPDGQPLPRTWARMRVAGSPDAEWFFRSGRLAADSIRSTMAGYESNTGRLRVLDFGCGCGRVLRHWRNDKNVTMFGVDFQQPLVGECHRVLPFAHLAVNGPEPPLPFLDESFDLIYCLSVFTHFDARQEILWRDEIRRVLKPGGLFVMSTQGPTFGARLHGAERRRFEEGQAVFQRTSFRGLNLCMTFHPETYVRRVLADGFSILDYRPEGAKGNPPQDLYLLRRDRGGRGPSAPAAKLLVSCL